MLIKGAVLPIPPILTRASLPLGHKSLPPVTCQCQTGVQIRCTLFLLPKILGNCSHFRGQMGVPLPTVCRHFTACPLRAIMGKQSECNEYPRTPFLSHSPVCFCFLLCWPAGWEGERSTSWFPSPQTSFSPVHRPFDIGPASYEYRDTSRDADRSTKVVAPVTQTLGW